MMRIAIVGATGHIGTALSRHYAARGNIQLALYSRRPEATAAAFADESGRIGHFGLDRLEECRADVLINAIGIGDPAAARVAGPDFYKLTMQIEDRIERAVKANPLCLTVFMSSGAVYGRLEEPANANTLLNLAINGLSPGDWYGAAKLAAELRHRAQPERRVLDIRVFGFVSRFLNLRTQYLVCDIVNAIRADAPMRTSGRDIARDYIGTAELVDLIDLAAERHQLNMAVDTYSLGPVRKFDLLEALRPLGLTWNVERAEDEIPRDEYWSRLHNAEVLGYEPHRRSIDIVKKVIAQLIRHS